MEANMLCKKKKWKLIWVSGSNDGRYQETKEKMHGILSILARGGTNVNGPSIYFYRT